MCDPDYSDNSRELYQDAAAELLGSIACHRMFCIYVVFILSAFCDACEFTVNIMLFSRDEILQQDPCCLPDMYL